MRFQKVGVLWQAPKRDKYGRTFMSGIIDEAITLNAKQRVFIFQTEPSKRGPKSPIATIVVGTEGEQYVPPVVQEPPVEDMPEPLPDESDPPF